MENRSEIMIDELGKSLFMSEKKTVAFYKDMRFWLVLLMLAVFLAFILVSYPN